MFISVKLVDGSFLMINPQAVATVRWGNPTMISLISGQQILLPDVDDNHQLFSAISREWRYESRKATKSFSV
jgi:uncharacterized protein YlzI (FlbEa/FlbD family)